MKIKIPKHRESTKIHFNNNNNNGFVFYFFTSCKFQHTHTQMKIKIPEAIIMEIKYSLKKKNEEITFHQVRKRIYNK